jgi:membrane protein DedA with SNARE-associated domain
MVGSGPRHAGVVALASAGWCLLVLAGTGWAQTGIEARSAAVVQEGSHLLERWGYAAIFGLVAVDFIGVPVPATTVLVAAAVAAVHGELRLPLVMGLAFAGVVVGSQIGYAIGRHGGAYVLHHLPISEQRLAKVDRGYARWGVWIVVLAPYIDGLRQLNAFTAGLLELPWWRFLAANLLGGALWVGGWVGGVYLIDEHLSGILPVLRGLAPLLLAVAAAALMALLVYLLRVPRKPNGQAAAPPPDPLAAGRSSPPEWPRERQDQEQDLEPAGQHPEHEQPFRGIADPGEGAARSDARP